MLRRWLTVRVATATLTLLAIGAGAWGLGLPASRALVLLLFAAPYAVNGIAEFLFHYFRGLGRSDVESTVVIIQRAALLVLGLAVLWWRPAALPLLALAMLLPALAGAVVAARLAATMRPTGRRDSQVITTDDAPADRTSRDRGRDILPIGLGLVLSALYFRLDLFLVASWLGADRAGQYNAVFRLVDALRLLPAAAVTVLMPTLFAARTTRPLIRHAAWLTAAAVALSGALVGLAAPLVVLAYGELFRGTVPVFRVLVLAFPWMTLNYLLTHQLIGWHGHRAYAVICAVALGTNVAANASLLPRLGMAGAAWSTLITELVVTAGCLVGLSRRRVAWPLPVLEVSR